MSVLFFWICDFSHFVNLGIGLLSAFIFIVNFIFLIDCELDLFIFFHTGSNLL